MIAPFGVTLWPPFDFGTSVVTPDVPEVVGRDWDILDDVVRRLRSLDLFGDVAWGASLELLFPSAEYPAAAVEYQGTTEATISDVDYMVKDGLYSLTLAVRDHDMRRRSAALQALAATARNALSGVSLADVCQPYFCRLKVDGPVDATPPESRLRLSGSYRYAIPDDFSRDESLDD